jgi:hypothetical protein
MNPKKEKLIQKHKEIRRIIAYDDKSAPTFRGKRCVVSWITDKRSTVVWDSLQDALDVHVNCHLDNTKLSLY